MPITEPNREKEKAMKVLEVMQGFGFELSENEKDQIKRCVGKEFVLRSDFNHKVYEMKMKIKELEEKNKSLCHYRNQYEDLLNEKMKCIKKQKFYELLEDAKEKDYLLYKYGGIEKLEFDDEGEIKNKKELLDKMKKENPDYFGQYLVCFIPYRKMNEYPIYTNPIYLEANWMNRTIEIQHPNQMEVENESYLDQ